MKIILNSNNISMCEEWDRAFRGRIEICNSKLSKLLQVNNSIDTIIAPGNSFVEMDGGYDLGIAEYIGKQGVDLLLKEAKKKYGGIIPVGNVIYIEHNNYKIIYIPTMYVPTELTDYSIVFTAMYNSLITAKCLNSNIVLIPAFGSGTGNIPERIVAQNMKLAYDYFKNKIDKNYLKRKIIFN